ncbi:MAG TPA: DUF998 domain-containing protein [Frankiaceae bacterium]|nr:DUF998 domain-containing protein [Frankiaceae bacterium]
MLWFVTALAVVVTTVGVVAYAVFRHRPHRSDVDRVTRARVGLAAVLGLLGAGLDSDWVVEHAVDGPADPRRGFVSELGAATQPHSLLFNGVQVVTGLLLLFLAVGLRQAIERRRPLTAACALLVVFAVGNTIDGMLPMDCAPSRSAACAHAENAGLVSWRDRVHSVESVVTIVVLLLAMALLAFGLVAAREWWPFAALTAVVVPPLTALEIYQAARVLSHHVIGTAERVSTGLITLWVGALAVAILRRLTAPHPLSTEAHTGEARPRSGVTRNARSVLRKPDSRDRETEVPDRLGDGERDQHERAQHRGSHVATLRTEREDRRGAPATIT